MLKDTGDTLTQSPTTGALLAPPAPSDSDSNNAPACLMQAESTAPAVTPAPTYSPVAAVEKLEAWIRRVAKAEKIRGVEAMDLASDMRVAVLSAKPNQRLGFYRTVARRAVMEAIRQEVWYRQRLHKYANLTHAIAKAHDDYSEDSQP